ncbi:hypothetical protein Pcinc_012427 [Petrolisthes cinctipes]|uniref:Nucleolus and neural progenitor protein-like N-terminal domain-containing protein n=1 Tax=Petrolisthes cinctipes TaxID=88211 RepID=A0AAE1KVE5_PETCI|nr:hypothetical protein Pcinc_012427 [Petrolisthes cinctipes]
MDVWNNLEIPSPPEYTIEYSPKERAKRKLDVYTQALLECLERGYALLSGEVINSIQSEFAVLAASLYQNGRFRPEKFFGALKKIQKCGEHWQQLNLASIMDRVHSLMPSILLNRRAVRLPSRQMFVYLVVRILGGYHLLQKLDDYCKEAGVYLMVKIKSGHFFCPAMAFLANAARIRALAVDLCGQLISLYNTIFPCLQQLKSSDAPELVSLSSLPSSLPILPSRVNPSTNKNFINFRETKDKSSALQTAKDNSKKTQMQASEVRPTQVLPEEDIGMCVEEMRDRIITPVNKIKKDIKRKLVSDYVDQNKICKNVKKTKLTKKKKERNSENLKPNEKTTTDKCKTSFQEVTISSAFVTRYKKVKAATGKLNSHKDVRQFLKLEQKRRCDKSDDRISLNIKKEAWNELKNTLLLQLVSSEKTGKQTTEDESATLCRVKTKLKFWLLYPRLKGKKPQDWSEQLKNIKLHRQKRRKS